MRAHVTATVRKCFSALRQTRSVRRSLPRHALLTQIRSLVVSSTCRLLQPGPSRCVWPAPRPAAVSSQRRRSTDLLGEEVRTHNPLLSELQWLRVPKRIQFRLCVLAYRCLHDPPPSYLAEILHPTTDVDGRCRLRSAATSTLLVPSTRRSPLRERCVCFRWRHHAHGADVRDAPSH